MNGSHTLEHQQTGRLAGLLWLAILLDRTANILNNGFNPDAGYFVGLASQISQGLVLYSELPTAYPPGAALLLSSLGPWLSSATAVFSLWGALHLLNDLLLFQILRRLNHSVQLSWLWVALYETCILHQDGASIVLEPLQIFFQLLSLLLLIGPLHPTRTLLAGLSLGAALMSKQYAILLVPAMLFYVASKADNRSKLVQHLGLFLVALPAPFLFFCAIYRLSPPDIFARLALFNARFNSYSGADQYFVSWQDRLHPQTLLGRFWRGLLHPSMLLYPWIPVAAAMIRWRQSPLHKFLLACFVLSLLPLWVRSFPHYGQLVTPWGVLLLAELYAAVHSAKNKRRLSLWLLVAIGPIMLRNQWVAYRELVHPPRLAQLHLTQQLLQLIPTKSVVAMDNLQWLYPLTGYRPPFHNYGFIDCSPRGQAYLENCDFFLLCQPDNLPASELARRRAWVQAAGLVEIGRLDGQDDYSPDCIQIKLHIFAGKPTSQAPNRQ